MADEAKRELHLTMARCAEQAERYEDMVDEMVKVMELKIPADDLKQDERNLISVAYKNMITHRRQAHRNLVQYPKPDHGMGEHERLDLLKEYKETIAKEIDEVITMVTRDVVKRYTEGELAPPADPSQWKDSNSAENLVFFFKMEGDYARYGAEIYSNGEDEPPKEYAAQHEKYKNQAKAAYEKADKVGKDGGLSTTNPIRLGLALNQSVFFYEICKQPKEAKELAKNAFDAAIDELDTLQEKEYKDSTLIMQLLKDNLTLWSEHEEGDEEDVEVENLE